MDDKTIVKAVPAVVASPIRKLAKYLRRNPVSSMIFVAGVLYSTVFIEYIANDRYFDLFRDQYVRSILVVLAASVAYIDPRVSVIVLISVLRTFRYVRKAENFSMQDLKNVAKPKWMKHAERRDDASSSSSGEVIELDEDFNDD